MKGILVTLCILGMFCMSGCAQENSGEVVDLEVSGTEEFEVEFEEVDEPTSGNVQVEIEYSPAVDENGNPDAYGQLIEIMDTYAQACIDNPVSLGVSEEILGKIEANPTAASDFLGMVDLYMQTFSKIDDTYFIRVAYDAESGTVSELFTLNDKDGIVTPADPEAVLGFISGGAYA